MQTILIRRTVKVEARLSPSLSDLWLYYPVAYSVVKTTATLSLSLSLVWMYACVLLLYELHNVCSTVIFLFKLIMTMVCGRTRQQCPTVTHTRLVPLAVLVVRVLLWKTMGYWSHVPERCKFVANNKYVGGKNTKTWQQNLCLVCVKKRGGDRIVCYRLLSLTPVVFWLH